MSSGWIELQLIGVCFGSVDIFIDIFNGFTEEKALSAEEVEDLVALDESDVDDDLDDLISLEEFNESDESLENELDLDNEDSILAIDESLESELDLDNEDSVPACRCTVQTKTRRTVITSFIPGAN